MYDNNIKQIRQNIRNELKEKYSDNYPSATVENIILDITQDKEYSIGIITNNILHLQNINFKSINVPIFNNSLNINVNIIDNVIVINNIKKDAISDYDKYSDIYETINNYKYIYSINNKILTDYDDSEKKNCYKKIVLVMVILAIVAIVAIVVIVAIMLIMLTWVYII